MHRPSSPSSCLAWIQLWNSAAGVKNPALDDLLALYTPAGEHSIIESYSAHHSDPFPSLVDMLADADVTRSAPVKYTWAIKSATHMSTGSGSIRQNTSMMHLCYQLKNIGQGQSNNKAKLMCATGCGW